VPFLSSHFGSKSDLHDASGSRNPNVATFGVTQPGLQKCLRVSALIINKKKLRFAIDILPKFSIQGFDPFFFTKDSIIGSSVKKAILCVDAATKRKC
jgi:hypothetical protein